MIWPSGGRRHAGRLEHGPGVAQFRGDFYRPFDGTVQITSNQQRAIVLQRPHRLRVDILNECLRHYANLDIAINASESQIIDLVSERRNVRTLPRIQFHLKQVVATEVEVRRDFERKRGVAAFIFGELVAVYRHGAAVMAPPKSTNTRLPFQPVSAWKCRR